MDKETKKQNRDTHAAAVRLLGKHLAGRLTKEGLINKPKDKYFSKEDVQMLVGILVQPFRSGSLHKTIGMAAAADFRSRYLEKKLDRLLSLLELDIPQISLEEKELLQLYEKVLYALKYSSQFMLDDILYWTRIFKGLSEEHFAKLEMMLGIDSAMYFLRLGKEIVEKVGDPSYLYDDMIMGYFHLARAHVRNVAYSHYAQTLKPTAISRKMKEVDSQLLGYDESILNQIFSSIRDN